MQLILQDNNKSYFASGNVTVCGTIVEADNVTTYDPEQFALSQYTIKSLSAPPKHTVNKLYFDAEEQLYWYE